MTRVCPSIHTHASYTDVEQSALHNWNAIDAITVNCPIPPVDCGFHDVGNHVSEVGANRDA